jgi:creatinine amidohydrolase
MFSRVGSCIALVLIASAASAQTTRELERINWMEFREYVPAKVTTVLLPLAFIAPVVPYGFTGSMDAYPGTFTVPEDVYRAYVRSVLLGLAKNRFKNIILINGHGGGQTAVLSQVAADVGREAGVRTLVINWWSYASDVTLEVFGQDGGHAGENENAFMMAIDPALVHKARYSPEMATANPAPGTWSAYPNPSTIGLYKAGEGYPTFDLAKAKEYYARVNDKVAKLIQEIIRKWDMAGL